MITFYTFGDSHSSYGCWNRINIPNLKFITNCLGPKTMSYFCIKEIVPLLENSNVDDIVCLFYGEVDCRNHIHKFETNYKTAIDNMVKRYFESIVELRNIYNNLKICIFNVVPPLEREKEEYRNKGEGFERGTDEDRKKYTLYTNEKLKEYCEEFNFIFFDVYDLYIDNNGFLNPNLSDGNCHIGDPKYMIDFIKNKIMKYED